MSESDEAGAKRKIRSALEGVHDEELGAASAQAEIVTSLNQFVVEVEEYVVVIEGLFRDLGNSVEQSIHGPIRERYDKTRNHLRTSQMELNYAPPAEAVRDTLSLVDGFIARTNGNQESLNDNVLWFQGVMDAVDVIKQAVSAKADQARDLAGGAETFRQNLETAAADAQQRAEDL